MTTKQFLPISYEVIDDILPVIGEVSLSVYLYLARHARWADTPSKIGSEFIHTGEVLRTIDQIADGTGIHRSSIHRALQKMEKIGLVAARALGSARILRLTEFSSHFRLTGETEPRQTRDETETKPRRERDETETILDRYILDRYIDKDTTPKRVRSPRRTPTLLPLESYKEIIIPDWKIIPSNPITPPKHELAPPNAICGIEAPLPIPRGDWLVPVPGHRMSAQEVYEAIFWVFPREWDAYTDQGGGFPETTDEWLKLEAWAISNREKFHTNKRYSNHTAWLKARLGEKSHGNYGSRAAYN